MVVVVPLGRRTVMSLRDSDPGRRSCMKSRPKVVLVSAHGTVAATLPPHTTGPITLLRESTTRAGLVWLCVAMTVPNSFT